MSDEVLKEVRADVKALHEKLDAALKKSTENSTDIEWLKRGAFGQFFTYIGALVYFKMGK